VIRVHGYPCYPVIPGLEMVERLALYLYDGFPPCLARPLRDPVMDLHVRSQPASTGGSDPVRIRVGRNPHLELIEMITITAYCS